MGDDEPRVTRGVRGGVAWRKGCGHLTDKVPRRCRSSDVGYALLEGQCRRVAVRRRRVRGMPWLSLLRDHCVSGGDSRQGATRIHLVRERLMTATVWEQSAHGRIAAHRDEFP